MAKWVYMFNEGSAEMRNLLGGKGATLAEMTNLGMRIPQGFTITTEACTDYYTQGKEISKEVEFTPTAKDGMVDVKFDDFSAAGLNGKYVVFEEVYVVIPEHTDKDGKKITSSTHLIGEHKDLTDSNQTITVSHTPKTGMTVFFIILGILAVGGAGMLIFRRKNVISK